MFIIRICCFICISLFFSLDIGTAFADLTQEEWLADKKRLEELTDDNRCEGAWDILWPWAKKGNLEARALLFFSMLPPPDMYFTYPPGNSGDYISRMREAVIMAVHSREGKELGYFQKEYGQMTRILYSKFGFEEAFGGANFLQCLNTNRDDCAEIAVKGKLVPSFEEYANQIDTFIAAGMKPTSEGIRSTIK